MTKNTEVITILQKPVNSFLNSGEKPEVENKKAELENLRASQESQLNDISARQADATNVVANLDDNVKDLIAQRDSELLAAQQEAERQEVQNHAER